MIKINAAKATKIVQDHLRSWRKAQFNQNDIAIQNALADGDDEARKVAIARRDELRRLPEICDGKTPDELKEILAKYK